MMKRNLLASAAAAIALGAACSAHADEASSSLKFLIGGGITYGGDTVAVAEYTNGDDIDVKAGGLVDFYGGVEYAVTENFALRATLGYQEDRANGKNGSIRFTRVPVDLIATYAVTPHVRLGAGLEIVSGPALKGSGVASYINEKFDSTSGVVLEGEYLFTPHMGLTLRYASLKYKPSLGGASVDGSYGGVLFSYYFF